MKHLYLMNFLPHNSTWLQEAAVQVPKQSNQAWEEVVDLWFLGLQGHKDFVIHLKTTKIAFYNNYQKHEVYTPVITDSFSRLRDGASPHPPSIHPSPTLLPQKVKKKINLHSVQKKVAVKKPVGWRLQEGHHSLHL